ncbi:MAG: 30S ribosome-binding factor RbfA [Verrucomicrobiia bacterium]
MSDHRMQRVSELVKQQVSEIVQGLNLGDSGFVTVTAAKISPDIKEGRIYISVIGSEAQREHALTTLSQRHALVQQELARRVVLRYTPRLQFFLDETEAHARRIEHLLDEIDHEDPH